MKNSIPFLVFTLVASLFVQGGCQSNRHSAPGGKSVFISKDVLKTAEWAEFKYKENLNQALTGNLNALQAFLEFITFVDGKERTEHAVTCYEMIPVVGDQVFSAAVQNLKPKMRDVLRNQIVFAAGKTEKPDLKGKQVAQEFPYTWAALNHAPLADGEKGETPTDADAAPGATAPGTTPDAAVPSMDMRMPVSPNTTPAAEKKEGGN